MAIFPPPNFGYNDFHLIGKGAYGSVFAGTHISSGTTVAIKVTTKLDNPITLLRTLREIRLLRHFREHENIVSICDVFYQPQSCGSLAKVYLVLERMDADLAHVLQDLPLSADQVEYITYQILRGLKAMHSAGVLHRDLKPSNILVNRDVSVKICDLGLARKKGLEMTEYVATRWYRAPEIMLDRKRYSEASDVWSVGCILAEMLSGGIPIFPGKDYHDQLSRILRILPQRTRDALASMPKTKGLEYVKHILDSRPAPKQSWKAHLPGAPDRALDLIDKLLLFDPTKRIDVHASLRHPYLVDWHNAADELNAEPAPEELTYDFCRSMGTQAVIDAVWKMDV